MIEIATTTWADIAVDGVGASMGGGVLTYAVPDSLVGELEPRQLVWVPLKSKLALGIVARVHENAPMFESRELHARVEPVMALTESQWQLARWLARETASGLYATASLFLPRGIVPSLAQRFAGRPKRIEKVAAVAFSERDAKEHA